MTVKVKNGEEVDKGESGRKGVREGVREGKGKE